MSLTRKLGRRLVWGFFVVWATFTIAFLVNHALPSDPARMVAGPQARPEQVAKVRKRLQLDRPVYVQYANFMGRLLHRAPPRLPDDASKASKAEQKDEHASCELVFGAMHLDLGMSYQQRRPVVTILAERIPRTALLAVGAALVQLLLGVTAGIIAAARKKTGTDNAVVTVSLLGVSTPTFVIGLFLQWIFAVRFRLLPMDGYGESAAEHLSSLVLPALTLGIFGAAYYTRMVRDEMIGQLSLDYVRTARAKGLSGPAVVVRHAFRNALLPVVTIFGLEVGTLVGGAIVTESIFRWPGLGSLSVTAMLDRDGPVIMGCVIVTSVAVVLATTFTDLAYALLDPRVRAEA